MFFFSSGKGNTGTRSQPNPCKETTLQGDSGHGRSPMGFSLSQVAVEQPRPLARGPAAATEATRARSVSGSLSRAPRGAGRGHPGPPSSLPHPSAQGGRGAGHMAPALAFPGPHRERPPPAAQATRGGPEVCPIPASRAHRLEIQDAVLGLLQQRHKLGGEQPQALLVPAAPAPDAPELRRWLRRLRLGRLRLRPLTLGLALRRLLPRARGLRRCHRVPAHGGRPCPRPPAGSAPPRPLGPTVAGCAPRANGRCGRPRDSAARGRSAPRPPPPPRARARASAREAHDRGEGECKRGAGAARGWGPEFKWQEVTPRPAVAWKRIFLSTGGARGGGGVAGSFSLTSWLPPGRASSPTTPEGKEKEKRKAVKLPGFSATIKLPGMSGPSLSVTGQLQHPLQTFR